MHFTCTLSVYVYDIHHCEPRLPGENAAPWGGMSPADPLVECVRVNDDGGSSEKARNKAAPKPSRSGESLGAPSRSELA